MAVKGMSVFSHQGEDYTINDPNNATEFDATVANEKGDYAYYQGDLYRFDDEHTANTEWSSRRKTKVLMGKELKNTKNDISGMRIESIVERSRWSELTSKADNGKYVTNKAYKPGYITSVVAYVDSDNDQNCTVYIYKANSSTSGTLVFTSETVSGHGYVEIPCNYLATFDFFIGLSGININYKYYEAGTSEYKTTGAIQNVTFSNTDYGVYHAYEVHMLAVYDILNECYVNDQDGVKRHDSYINSSSQGTVLTLPTNRIFEVEDSADWQSFGLPQAGPGTLIKFSPRYENKTGYCIFLYCVFNSANTKMYYAYGVLNQTLEELVWHTVADSPSGLNNPIEGDYAFTVKDSNMVSAGYQSILDLPNNRIYRVDNLSLSYGVPEVAYGLLYKFTSYGQSYTATGYVTYIYVVVHDGGPRIYYAFAVNNQTISALDWVRLGEKVRGISKLGLASMTIGFLGDSITEGYGSSDYNGGASGTSGHLIPNNVKTWYRNTGTKCWANKMKAYIEANYSNVICFNNGIGGFNCSNIYENLSTLALDDNGNLADVIILMIGTNNVNSTNKINLITDQIVNSIRWLKARGVVPIILTNTPLLGQTAPNNAETVQSAIKLACERTDTACYDILSEIKYYMWEENIPLEKSTDQTKFMYDDWHPADIGYEVIFEVVKKQLTV